MSSSKMEGPSHWRPPKEPHCFSEEAEPRLEKFGLLLVEVGGDCTSKARAEKLPLLEGLPTTFQSGSSCTSIVLSFWISMA